MTQGLFWFRRDLRLADHPALARACQSHDRLLLVYVDDDADGPFDASRAWLRLSLGKLGDDIRARGGELHLLAGDPEILIPALAVAAGATEVHISALHEPKAAARDARIAATLAGRAIAMRRAGGRLLTDAESVLTQSATPFRVFTPFHKAARPTWRHRPREAPTALACSPLPSSLEGARTTLDAPRPRWDKGFWATWTPGEAAAHARLDDLLPRLHAYPDARDVPSVEGTSRLSPHLHFGEIHPSRIFDVVQRQGGIGADKYIAELGWREFAYYVLHHWPASLHDNFNPKFDAMPWRDDPAGLRGLAARPDRRAAGRCRHAPVVARGLDAQPRAHGGRFVADQAHGDRLAAGRALVHAHPGRCRPGQQHAGLAMGCRHRRGCRAVFPHLQSGHPVAPLRSAGRVPASLASRTARAWR
jgi:deoxyribodipyrimidine photo-lyase